MGNNKPEATEEEYLRYFFECADVSKEERSLLEKRFEKLYNKKVPIDLCLLPRDTNPSLPYFITDAPTPTVELDPVIDVDVSIPGPPKLPEEFDTYIEDAYDSPRRISISSLIAKLRKITK